MSAATQILVLSTVTTGIMLGVIFSLVAVGVTIVYGSIWMPNAANGQFFLLAALFAWSASVSWGLHPAVAALVLVLVGAGGLLYAPDNKTVIKVVILVVGVLIGLGGWLWARIPRR